MTDGLGWLVSPRHPDYTRPPPLHPSFSSSSASSASSTASRCSIPLPCVGLGWRGERRANPPRREKKARRRNESAYDAWLRVTGRSFHWPGTLCLFPSLMAGAFHGSLLSTLLRAAGVIDRPWKMLY